MATVTVDNTASVVASAASAITALDQKVASVVADVTAAKAKVVSALQTHIAQHEAAVAAHQAEVNAAQALIAKAVPTSSPSADQAAAFILTSSSQVQGIVRFLGRNWRYVVIAGCLGVVAYGVVVLHLFR